jgi:hypothetical protein
MYHRVQKHLQSAMVGVFDRYEIRVSKAAIVASFPHSMTRVIDVVVTTPITPGPRRMGIHSIYACAAFVNRMSAGPSLRSHPASSFSVASADSLTGQIG